MELTEINANHIILLGCRLSLWKSSWQVWFHRFNLKYSILILNQLTSINWMIFDFCLRISETRSRVSGPGSQWAVAQEFVVNLWVTAFNNPIFLQHFISV